MALATSVRIAAAPAAAADRAIKNFAEGHVAPPRSSNLERKGNDERTFLGIGNCTAAHSGAAKGAGIFAHRTPRIRAARSLRDYLPSYRRAWRSPETRLGGKRALAD